MASAREIIESMQTRFIPSAAPRGYVCRVHIHLRGSDVSTYTVHIANGKCTVVHGLEGEPDAQRKADADTYAAVALGKQRIEWAVMRRQIQLSPISTMRTFSKLFEQPSA